MDFKNKLIAGVAAALAAVGLIASPAYAANTDVAIDNLQSPNGYGALRNSTLTWSDGHTVTYVGRLYDLVSEGTGPYLHFYVNLYNGDTYQQARDHNTNGAGTSIYVDGGVIDYSSSVTSINMWVCNGGDATGYAAKGCYGRRYYNQKLYPGKASVSLGTTTQAHGSSL